MKIRTRFLVASLLLAGSLLFAAPLEIARGNLKLILYPDTGSFCLYHLSDIGKNRYEPLFEDRNSAATSWFSVLSNGRVFRLSSRIGHPVVLEPTDTGARFIFTLTDDFQVEQAFSFVESSDKTLPVELKIETRIENTSGKDGVFALKALVDTTLGESEGIHFVTNMRNRISAETRFERNVDPDSVIVSKNKAQSLMFLLSGDDVSPPECLYVQNWDRLNTRTWKPDFLEGRSFNTLYAINDSALLFVWPEKTLVTGKKNGRYHGSRSLCARPRSGAENRRADRKYFRRCVYRRKKRHDREDSRADCRGREKSFRRIRRRITAVERDAGYPAKAGSGQVTGNGTNSS